MCVDWSIVGLLEVDLASLLPLMCTLYINVLAVRSKILKMREFFKTKVERCACTEPEVVSASGQPALSTCFQECSFRRTWGSECRNGCWLLSTDDPHRPHFDPIRAESTQRDVMKKQSPLQTESWPRRTGPLVGPVIIWFHKGETIAGQLWMRFCTIVIHIIL